MPPMDTLHLDTRRIGVCKDKPLNPVVKDHKATGGRRGRRVRCIQSLTTALMSKTGDLRQTMVKDPPKWIL